MVLARHNLHSLLWLVKGTATVRKEYNKGVMSVSDWPIIVIGPGGLLLVVPHIFAVPVSVLWFGLKKSK
jgi:hypothetical protein